MCHSPSNLFSETAEIQSVPFRFADHYCTLSLGKIIDRDQVLRSINLCFRENSFAHKISLLHVQEERKKLYQHFLHSQLKAED